MTAQKVWGHDQLATDLAAHLALPNRMVWTDMQLGPSHSSRPDVFTMQKSYTSPKPMSYEIKVSVSDFRSDVTSGKWQKYLDYSAGVYFCVPRGLIKRTDIPDHTGLMVRGDTGWKSIKKPTLARVSVPWMGMQKLLIDGVTKARENCRPEWAKYYFHYAGIKKQLGQDVASAVNDLSYARELERASIHRVKTIERNAREEAKRILEMARDDAAKKNKAALKKWNALLSVLDLPEESSQWQVVSRLKELLDGLDVDKRLAAARTAVDQAAKSVTWARQTLEAKK